MTLKRNEHPNLKQNFYPICYLKLAMQPAFNSSLFTTQKKSPGENKSFHLQVAINWKHLLGYGW